MCRPRPPSAASTPLTRSRPSPAVMRKHPSVVQAAVPLALGLIAEVEDDPAWPHGTYADLDFDEDDAEQIGISAVGRLSDALGGAAILPVAFSSIPQFAADAECAGAAACAARDGCSPPPRLPPQLAQAVRGDDGRQRARRRQRQADAEGDASHRGHGAAAARGAPRSMSSPRFSPTQHRLMHPPLSPLPGQDAHPRVRFAAVHCLGRLAEDFKGKFQPKHHAQVVPALVSLLGNGAECERVRGHAISAVCSFADEDNCPASALTPYLQPLLEALFATLQQGCGPDRPRARGPLPPLTVAPQRSPRVLQEEALSAVSSLAAVTGTEFLRFYDVFMPPLKTLLREATSGEMQTLRGRAMQCIGPLSARGGGGAVRA